MQNRTRIWLGTVVQAHQLQMFVERVKLEC